MVLVMITNLSREFKLTKVPKVVINPDDDKIKQINKFWNYMYKSTDLANDTNVLAEVEDAIHFFYGGVVDKFLDNDLGEMFLGNSHYGEVKHFDYYGRISGYKVNKFIGAVVYNRDFEGLGLYMLERDTSAPLNRYDNMSVLVDYTSLRGESKLGLKKGRTTLFSEASSIYFSTKGYVTALVDAKALWIAYKFICLISECMEGIDYGEIDKNGYVKMGAYKIAMTSNMPTNFSRYFFQTGTTSKRAIDYILSVHPAIDKLLKMLHSMYTDQIMLGFQESYDVELGKTQAAVFQTKKHITKEKLALMESSKLLNKFSFVEIDNDIDNDIFRFIESAIDKFPWVLPNGTVELRFRKLGNYKATGLWFPYMNNLCVDIRDITSFVHEYGHAIDYLLTKDGRTQLSLQVGFVDIRTKVFKKYQEMKLQNIGYFGVPTEIFARAFEVYVFNKGYYTNMLPFVDSSELEKEYAPFGDEDFYKELIEPYFDRLLGVDTVKNTYPNHTTFVGVLVCEGRAIWFDTTVGVYQVSDLQDVVVRDPRYVVEITKHAFLKVAKVISSKKYSDDEKIMYISEGYEGFFE